MKIIVEMDSTRVEGAFGFHVEVLVKEAPSAAEALAAVHRTTHMLADGKRALFRVMPEVASDKNFDTKITHHKGYARFTLLDEPGEWEILSPTQKIPSIGLANSANSVP